MIQLEVVNREQSNQSKILTARAEKFFDDTIRYNAFKSLTLRETLIIDGYIGTDANATSLSEVFDISVSTIKLIISRAVSRLYRHLPPDIQVNYQLPLRIKSRSAETRAKIGAARNGKSQSPETREKISKSLLGKTLSSATKAKMSQARRGKPNPMAGRSHSIEARAKMSAARQQYLNNKKNDSN